MALPSRLRLVSANSSRTLPARKTIMLVDDDFAVARTLASALELAGYRVRIAATGSAARALLSRLRPDLIVMDLMLPDTDGFVLTTTLSAMTDVPIIICTARWGIVDRALGLRLGAVDFVAKPFDLDDFIKRVSAALGTETRSAIASRALREHA